ncbi:conserved hypothetical protein [Rickettsia prowazekii str. Rp22]|uniref:Uncharacterized protein RP080 n=2 Tax=Rickettsia prowazekii TaxID=782 RepID=Y080_RICPR|nr:RecName: Full=Uncharacterized protein RP080 [Rickettsia prowazekii str. Madrid E]ADE29591.1 conserved hypothetical protein [Rickettsia prowazekii str. Rp22]AMS12007.1 hypothetical protein AR462_00395 [Rickettsia prowazekii]CAA14550.1 unknown [Rickettsia prowazekii str. Madrid E]
MFDLSDSVKNAYLQNIFLLLHCSTLHNDCHDICITIKTRYTMIKNKAITI